MHCIYALHLSRCTASTQYIILHLLETRHCIYVIHYNACSQYKALHLFDTLECMFWTRSIPLHVLDTCNAMLPLHVLDTKRSIYTRMLFECPLIAISNLNLLGLFSTELGKNNLENSIIDWDLRVRKWHSEWNRVYSIDCIASSHCNVLLLLNCMPPQLFSTAICGERARESEGERERARERERERERARERERVCVYVCERERERERERGVSNTL